MSLCEEAPHEAETFRCIDTLYLELPFLDRFQAAKEDGFDAVEFWSWADRDLSAVNRHQIGPGSLSAASTGTRTSL